MSSARFEVGPARRLKSQIQNVWTILVIQRQQSVPSEP